MRRVIPFVMIAGLLVLPALAQERQQKKFGKGGQFGQAGGFGRLTSSMLLTQKSVQEDLKLTAEQVKKIEDISAKQRQAMQDSFRGGGGGGDFKELGKKMAEVMQANAKELEAVLQPEQSKRLKQITLQVQGPRAILEAAKDLNLTDEQRKKVEEIQEEIARRRAELVGGRDATREEARKRTQEMSKVVQEKLLAVLTADQQAKWKEMTGEPFKGEIQMPNFQGRRRPDKS